MTIDKTILTPNNLNEIPITKDPDGTVHIGTKVLTPLEYTMFVTWLGNGKEVIVKPKEGLPLRSFQFCQDLQDAYAAASRLGAVDAFSGILGTLCDFLELGNAPKINKKGAPAPAGAVAAARSAITALAKFATQTANAHVKPDELSKPTDDLEVWWKLGTMLKTAVEKIARNAIPEAKDMVKKMRQVLTAVSPVLDTDHDLTVVLEPMLAYLKDPHRKAVKSRKANKRKAKALVEKTQAEALPQARDQARQEIKGQLGDHLAGFLGNAPVQK